MEKSRSVILSKDNAIKKFENKEELDLEIINLKDLAFLKGKRLTNGWTIEIPEIIEIDLSSKCFTMNRINGKIIDELIVESSHTIPWTQIGEALAVFHNNKKADLGKVFCFGDYNRSNILISHKSKTIGIIDPGYRYGQKSSLWRDVLLFERALWFGKMKYKKKLSNSQKQFRKGYLNTTEINIDYSSYSNEVWNGWQDISYGASKQNSLKKMLYLAWGGLWMIKSLTFK